MKRKYKSVITKRIFRSMDKIGVCLLVLMFLTPLMAMRGTNSGFSDEEKSENNILTANSLDARASYVERFSVTGMTPEDQPNQNMKFANEGGLDFRYGINYRQTGGDDTLCNAFLLTAERNGVKVYNKLHLKDFNMNQFPLPLGSPFEIARFGHDNWNFKVELPADADSTLENKTCQWNFDFTAWQTDMPDATQGFSDTETVGTHSIATGEWLTPGDVIINEVMWMGSTVSPLDEWIELKNMTGSAIPIAGWKIENAGPSHGTITLPTRAFIPAHGYYLIANYAETNVLSALNADVDYDVNLNLNDTGNGNLVLKNNTTPAIVIDSALGTPDWGAGNHGSSTPLEQSMERKDNPVPGDGLLDTSWHPCISGDANRLPYWDAIGNNYGTPKAANLSPVVLNEIMFNPSDGDKEWVELYNISGEDIDVSGWYFKNSDGDKIVISKENGDNNKNLGDKGETKVLSKERLVVHFENEYLGNEKDEVSLYNDMGTPDDEKDDVREDVYKYEDSTKKAGDSLMRIPDGVGIWIDPEATLGEENKLADKEIDGFRLLAYDKCFDEKGKLEKNSQTEICAPAFLQYLGMIKELDDKKIKDSTLLDILDMIIKEEENKLATLLEETAELNAGEIPAIDAPVAVVDGALEVIDDPVAEPKDDITAEIKKEDVTPPVEPVQPLPAPSAAEEIPKETKTSNTPPSDVQKETNLEPETLTTTL